MNRAQKDHLSPINAEIDVDQFGLASATLLREGGGKLPPNIKDRLYQARMKALAAHKHKPLRVSSKVLSPSVNSSTGTWSSGSNPLWNALGWMAPLVVLVFGLIAIAQWQEESRINDIAEVDAALLSDDVPPDAYADSGFMAFLKNGPVSDSNQPSDSVDQSNPQSSGLK